jgi:exopolyphosphatase/guanosine-5'-triphosphate,3'-diphosphate pyrophosphatase
MGSLVRPGRRVAVIDVGSNSGRVVVYERDPHGQLRILAAARAALRLVRDVEDGRRLTAEAVARTVEALRDFRAIALGAGADRTVAVATAAMRDAANGREVIARVRRELGIALRIIDGQREAHYGFLGGVRGLPVDHGLLFDIGGGSLELARFRDRRLVGSWTLPLGALRLSHLFLRSDPPRRGEVRRLRAHVRARLEEAGLAPLRRDEALIGTGGTVRNLAKIDRRAQGYPIPRLHGYVLPRRRVEAIAALLSERRLRKREKIPGLSRDRGDSVVGGVLAVETLMDLVRAQEVQVSGQGVREGVAHSLFGDEVPSRDQAREASLASVTSRFWGYDPRTAARRADIAASLASALLPGGAEEVRGALAVAARVLDVGRSMDYFERYAHAADIVRAADLDGFSHREVALVSAIIRSARDEVAADAYRPLLRDEDWPVVRRAAVLLALADDIEERCPRRSPVALRCRVERREAVVTVPALAAWRPRDLAERFQASFGRRLVVKPGGVPR